LTIFTGEICTYSGRPIVVDDKNPQVARCRKCGAPYLPQSWFAAGEKCIVVGCDGKAADISAPKIKDTVGDICPFLPPDPPRKEGASATPAKCLKSKCMLYDGVEKRCGLGEIAYTLASVRSSGRAMRNLIQQSIGSSTKQSLHLLTTLANAMRSTEKEIKALVPPAETSNKSLDRIAGLLDEVKAGISRVGEEQRGIADGFDRLAGAVEASGVGERVRGRRDARLAARAALRDGRPGAAVNLLLRAQERAGDEAVANDLATAYVKGGKYDEASEVLERVLADKPDYTPCRITLATLKLRAGEAQSAEGLLKDAPNPPNPLLRAELAYAKACVAYAVGRSEDAVSLLNEALDEDPWHAPAAAALADLRARRMGDEVPDAAAIAVEAAGMKAAPNGAGEQIEEPVDG
jgi:hypothetical protein